MAGAIILIAAAIVGGIFLGVGLVGGGASERPSEGSVDIGFARDMREHHAQAVEMSVLVRQSTDDPEVQNLSLDILLTQQQQLGQMAGWLNTWGVPQHSADPPMQWIPDDENAASTMPEDTTHDEMDMSKDAHASMPGMASSEQLEQLDRATGTRAERLYLQLMIPHHEAGVTMAEYAAKHAEEPYVRRLAQSIVDSQSAEIAVLNSMLTARGGALGSR